MAYSDDELEIMLADIESDLVERKESLAGDARKTIRQAVCAMANDLPGHGQPGVVFVGATDKGTPTGLEITDELLQQLSDIKTDGNTVPPPTLSVQRRNLHGADIAVITVQPSDSPPVRFRGRIWIRVGPRRDIATAQDERMLNEKRRYGDAPFDAQPLATATTDGDLDLRRFEEEYLPQAVSREVLESNERSVPERLAATKMVATAEDPVPTVTGMLVIGTRPQDFLPDAYIQFLRIAGTTLADEIVDEARCDGPVVHMMRRLDEKLKAYNHTAVDITSGHTDRRRPTYPLPALQQLVRNAVMHRTYEGVNAPVHVYWFDDRIEITNPGGPYGGVTIENFGRPGIVSYRNPNLAEAMRALGLVQRYGVGIPLARRKLIENGQPEPVFDVDPHWVNCTVRVRP
ncbi:ATP-binding protein [Candidatus Palauibacter sp.]|uniref:ATP-binding protein n=1 Tax=Candidatus Palauibacter sp. TaxID=3101350 RepID=UPI003B010211